MKVCEHSLLLQQEPYSNPEAGSCAKCELKTNLWKCLTCGTLSCGRKQFDRSGGNGHALEHFQSTRHSLAVKLGTIAVKADGLEADIYCYSCDDLVLDPELNSHLAVIGIDIVNSRKTEKSTAELNLDVNLTHTYSMTDSSGTELKELKGPWLRGFTNLGNSCYLASVIQSLRNLDQDAFLARDHSYTMCSSSRASDCLACQLRKLYDGMCSEVDKDFHLKPWMFKTQAAGDNSEFKSARQQDASEFLSHLLQNRFKRLPELAPLTRCFEIEIQESIDCKGCGAHFTNCCSETSLILPTPENRESCELAELLQIRFSSEALEGWRCGECKNVVEGSRKQSKIVNLPKYLVIVANRLKIKNWVPEKTECHIRGMGTEEPLCLEQFCGLKTVSSTSTLAVKLEADPVLMGELLMMGIEEDTAKKALLACKNSSVDSAMSLIFDGSLEDVASTSSASYSPEAVETLMSAGFPESKAKSALDATGGDLERAFDWIFSHPDESEFKTGAIEQSENDTISFDSKYKLSSFITHKGSSVFCGHYVAHLKNEQTGKWNLYNDEKVAESVMDDSFPIEDAYIYIYKKV